MHWDILESTLKPYNVLAWWSGHLRQLFLPLLFSTQIQLTGRGGGLNLLWAQPIKRHLRSQFTDDVMFKKKKLHRLNWEHSMSTVVTFTVLPDGGGIGWQCCQSGRDKLYYRCMPGFCYSVLPVKRPTWHWIHCMLKSVAYPYIHFTSLSRQSRLFLTIFTEESKHSK